ncbi:MAG TPA: hypothetical protein VNH20_00200 [Candidatus Dormibacteraeota bacterium]|nr:hypothetical protein [Candidatus Dormibacteraeota bacterium]
MSVLAPAESVDLDASPRQEALAEGITDGVSSQILGLWIDLVRQAEGVVALAGSPETYGLSRVQLRALDALPVEGIMMSALARRLGISGTAATAVADRLTSVGATVRDRDELDRRQVRLVATPMGVQLASRHRRGQVYALEHLLEGMDPARVTVLGIAMRQLAGTEEKAAVTPASQLLTPDPERWLTD